MAKFPNTELLYKQEKLRRTALRKAKRKEKQENRKPPIGSVRYERLVERGLIQTCEWGSRRCDLHGCNGDC